MIRYILYAILILAPIARGAVRIWAYGLIYILTLIMLVFWVINMAKEKEIRMKRTPIDIPILLFALISIISIINSRYIYGSIMEIMKFAILALIFYIVINFITGMKQIKRTLDIILMIGSGIALFGILQYLGIIDKSWWHNPRFLSATYVNHNHFAGLIELVMPISVGMILSEKDAGKRSLYIYSFLILCVAFLLSMSRGAWFSLSLSMLFMFVIIYRKGKGRFIFCITALLIVVLGIFVFNAIDIELLLTRVSSYRELDFSGRLEIWKGTTGLIMNNWFLGTGPGTFIFNFPKYRPPGLNMLVNYAHNDYLQIASEMGIFALIGMIFIIATIIRKGIKTHSIARSSFKKWISLSLAIGALSLIIHGSGDFNFYIPSNAIIFTVFAGFIFNISSRKEKEIPQFILKFNSFSVRFFKPFMVTIISLLILFISSCLAAEIYSTASDRAIFTNDLKRAEHFMLSAKKISPFNYTYPYKLASIYRLKSHAELDGAIRYLKASERECKRSLYLNPMDSWSWIGLADTYNRLFKYSSLDYGLIGLADSAYRTALDLDPLNSYYLKKFAVFLLNIEDADLSSQMYKKASFVMNNSKTLSLLPMKFADAEFYEDIAALAFSAQDTRKAITFYKMAERFDKNSEEAKLGQVRSYLKMSLIKNALQKYRHIKHSKRNKSALFASLGEYYLKKGYIETAARFSEKSTTLDASNAEGYQLKYKILKKIDKRNEAISVAKNILDFNNMPISSNFNSHDFYIKFELEEDYCKEKLYKEGKFCIDAVLPAGVYELLIKAKGKDAINIWPHMVVKFNGKNSMDVYINEPEWKYYKGVIIVDYPVNKIEMIYDNDYYDPENAENRVLYVSEITLNSLY